MDKALADFREAKQLGHDVTELVVAGRDESGQPETGKRAID